MALTDKNILITPNIGQSADPQIVFSGADASSGPNNITVKIYPTDNGTLSFEGTAGQLFSITNSLSGTIYSVNDISGIPSIEVLDTGLIKFAEYSGNVLIGTGVDNGLDKVQVSGFISMGGLKQAQITVTAAATTDLNFSSSNNFYLTLDQNVTFTFSNVANNIGASGYIFMLQDGTGGKTFTLPAVAKTPGGRTISQVTTANSLSMINYYVVSATVVVINYIGDFK